MADIPAFLRRPPEVIDPGAGPAPAEAIARMAEIAEVSAPPMNDQFGVKAPPMNSPAAGQIVGAAIYRGYEAAKVEAEAAGKHLLEALERVEAEAQAMAADYATEVTETMRRVRADVEDALSRIQDHMTSLRERGEQALTFIQSEAASVTTMAHEFRELVGRHGGRP
jgi:hypothetical protein